jgi:hypothetical protein
MESYCNCSGYRIEDAGAEGRFASVSTLETVVLSDTIQPIEQDAEIHQKRIRLLR